MPIYRLFCWFYMMDSDVTYFEQTIQQSEYTAIEFGAELVQKIVKDGNQCHFQFSLW